MKTAATVLEVPDSPTGSGAPYWYWLGGRPALDFVNTRRERWRREVDCLLSDADVVRWLTQAGLLPGSMTAPAGLLAEARDLREAVDNGVRAVVEGGSMDPAALTLVDDWLIHAGSRPALLLQASVPVLGERPPADSPRRALGMVALDASCMLGRPEERLRVRVCASETCSARFFDRSPSGRRRWCSMALCGNVAKARRHRARSA